MKLFITVSLSNLFALTAAFGVCHPTIKVFNQYKANDVTTSSTSPSTLFYRSPPLSSFDDATITIAAVNTTSPSTDSAIDKNIKIAIAGGGIGGMALGLSLADAGFTNVDIYESVPNISELGVGVNIRA